MEYRTVSSADDAPPGASALPDEIPSLIDGRFELQQELTHNLRESKWRGIDRCSGQPVIIRLIATDSLPAGTLMRLEHEVLLRQNLHSEYVASLLFAGRVGRHYVIVREFVPGVSLAERIAAGPLDYVDTLTVGAGVFAALRDQHRLGVLHRGIRPSNVIVNEFGPVTEVRLVNFGPARPVCSEEYARPNGHESSGKRFGTGNHLISDMSSTPSVACGLAAPGEHRTIETAAQPQADSVTAAKFGSQPIPNSLGPPSRGDPAVEMPGSGTLPPAELEMASYLSPEQSGLLEQDVAEPSDIYSAGVLLFHCVCGHPPFQSSTLRGLLFDHMTSPVPSLRDRNGRIAGVQNKLPVGDRHGRMVQHSPSDQGGTNCRGSVPNEPPAGGMHIDVPRAFEELVHRALKKDPRDRYQSAEAVLADITELHQALVKGVEPSIVIGAHDHRRSLTEPAFVSRTVEMDVLDRLRAQAAEGRANVVSLEGESGAGKTRLLDETARRGAGAGFRVYRGRGTNDVAREPFQLLQDIVEGVASDVRRYPSHGETLRDSLGEDASVVCAALPALADVLGPAQPDCSEEPVGPKRHEPSRNRSEQTPRGGHAAKVGGGVESFGEARTIEALAHLISLLGNESRPALIILDDCQWADEQTHHLIRQWQERIERGTGRTYVQLIVAFRSEEVGDAHVLRQKPADAHVRLSALTDDEVRRLATSMAGPLPDAALETVVRLANGSPFLASAVLRGLVESEALVGSDEGWTIDALVMEHVQSSSHAGSLLSRRLDLLPADTLQFLAWGAVLGNEFDIDQVARLSRQTAERVILAIDEARRRHLIWCRQDGAECVFVHDKIREALLNRESEADRHGRIVQNIRPVQADSSSAGTVQNIPPEADRHGRIVQNIRPVQADSSSAGTVQNIPPVGDRHGRIVQNIRPVQAVSSSEGTVRNIPPVGDRRERHRQAALDLERHMPERISALSFHFDAAGLHREALPYALEAAEQASEQHALEIAEQQYLIARRGSTEADRELRFRIEHGLGNVLMVRGRYADAARAFERAAEVADSVFARAELQGKLAELAQKRGDMEQAVEDYSSALRLLGSVVPQSTLVLLLMFVWEGIIQGLHTALPSLFVHRRRRPPNDVDRLKMRLYSGLSHGYWYCRSKLAVYWSHLRGMNLAERYPPTLELAQIYADHAPAMTIIPVPAFRRGLRYAEKSLSIRKMFGDLWGQGQSLHYFGIVHYAASDYRACIDRCRESIRILERLGDYWQVHIARYQIAACYYRLGDLEAALTEARLNHKSGLELGDEQASGIILDVWAWATAGSVPPEILRRERARERHDAQGAAQVLCAQGVCRLRDGDAAGAVESLEQAIRICEHAGVRNDYTRPLLTWQATALREWAEQIHDITPTTRRLLLQRALAAARRAAAATRFYRNEQPHALRELGLIHAMQGRVQKGLRLIHRSLDVARQLDAEFEHALSLVARLRLCKELRRPEAVGQLREAEARVAAMLPLTESTASGRSADDLPSLSLVDRFGTVLDAGRKIASALSRNIIFEELQAAATLLLRPETCTLIGVSRSGDVLTFAPLDPHFDQPLRESLLADAVRCGHAVTDRAATGEHETPAVQDTEERSVLCAPIQVRGRVVACLYASHRNVSGLFGPTEERLADFVTTIAGAALENAEGFESLQRLNATLERRVADRTRVVAARAKELAESNEMLEQTARRLREAQADLIKSKKQVEVASEAKSRFLAAMSHEVRTPMNGIIGMAELALRTSLTDQQQEYVNTIRESASVLLALLNDVLDFSKIEAGKMQLEDVPLSLHEIVGGCVRMLAGRAAEKNLELICRIAPDVPLSVTGDPSRLRQVLINLLGNAIKFTASGEVLVHVWREDGDNGPQKASAGGDAHAIHMLVQDTGIGIPQEQQQAIFEAFNQAGTSVTRQFGGTGLGLSISSELVSLMQGRLWVESEPGAGSRFHVVVPLGIDKDVQLADVVAHQDDPASVLLLSENTRAAAAYEETLAGSGLQVAAVSRPDEAELAWREAQSRGEPFSLLLLDARADADVDPDLLHRLRSMIGDEACPLVLLTPVDQMVSADHFRERGADVIAMKPIVPHELKRCVHDLLIKHNHPSELNSTTGDLPMGNESSTTRAQSGRPLRVLVADDSAVNREVAGGLLEFLGHHVTVVNNGREAFDAARQKDFDVVLMDIEMPEMDGYEATRAIREAESLTGAHLPIIAMSAHATEELASSGHEAGMDHYVSKPIEPAQIKYVLEHLDEFVADAAS